MRKITDWFDYIFYRSSLTYRYFKDDSTLSPTLVVTVIKSITLIDIYVLTLNYLESKGTIENGNHSTAVSSVIFVTILWLDYNHFKGKYDTFDSKWKTESRGTRTLKGILVFLTFVAPWIPLIVKGLIN